MEISIKVGNKKPSLDLAERAKYWRDGQIVDIRPDGYYSKSYNPHRCVIHTPHDFWDLRGSRDWKSTIAKVYDLKKLLYVADDKGRYPWDLGFNEESCAQRVRDRFIDLKWLLDQKWITLSDFESAYDKSKPTNNIYIDRDITSYIFHEEDKTRLPSDFMDQKASWTTGTYTVGAAGDATDLADAESNLDAQFTGDVTLNHLAEETAISAVVTFDVDTNSHTLKITAASGAEHAGVWSASKARVNYGTYDYLSLDETTNGNLDDVIIEKLQIDISGTFNYAVIINDGGDSGVLVVQRNIIKGAANSIDGIYVAYQAANVRLVNNIIYDIGDGAGDGGIRLFPQFAGGDTWTVYNNTIIGCYDGIIQEHTDNNVTHLYVKNNLVQASGNEDFRDDGGRFGTTGHNVSEDATSPDAAYQSKDVHTNSVFTDYASDEFTLDSGGDATNLAILDDGDDLSGTFTDDVAGQTRDTWYIGASEIAAAGTTTTTTTAAPTTTTTTTTAAPTTTTTTTAAPTTTTTTTTAAPTTTTTTTTAAPTTTTTTTTAPTTTTTTTTAAPFYPTLYYFTLLQGGGHYEV